MTKRESKRKLNMKKKYWFYEIWENKSEKEEYIVQEINSKIETEYDKIRLDMLSAMI